jgi:hypothetical protein
MGAGGADSAGDHPASESHKSATGDIAAGTSDPRESELPADVLAAVNHPEGILIAAGKTEKGKPIPVGSYVCVTAGNKTGELEVDVYSGIGGKAKIPAAAFRPEPGLVLRKDDAGKDIGPRDDTYQKYDAPLWHESGPKKEDADVQGKAADCYFLCALGEICKISPEAIKSRISPKGPSEKYSIRFWEDAGDGTMRESKTYAVDRWLPALRNGDHAGERAYARGPVLWPALFEKAWAMHKGSYEDAQWGWGSDAMAALTGIKSQRHSIAGNDGRGGGLIDRFRQLQRDGVAVTVSTRKDPDETSTPSSGVRGRFVGSGENGVSGQLDPSLVFESVQVGAGPLFQVKDDGNNKMVQFMGSMKLQRGTVDYETGKVELTFDEKVPETKGIAAIWSCCGAVFQEYGLVTRHVYRFDGVAEPDGIKLKNPWGRKDPKKPLPHAIMPHVLSEIASNPGRHKPDKKHGERGEH